MNEQMSGAWFDHFYHHTCLTELDGALLSTLGYPILSTDMSQGKHLFCSFKKNFQACG
jgi:hypothetical protein